MRTSLSDRAICSFDRTTVICGIDGKILGDERYVKINKAQYYVAINAWLAMIRDCGFDDVAEAVRRSIVCDGLLATIKLCSETADYLIAVANGDKPPYPGEHVLALETCFTSSDLRKALQCMRFLKRFTPQCKALLKAASASFIEIQERLNWRKHVHRTPDTTWVMPPYDVYILRKMRKYVTQMIGNWEIYWECEVGDFSNGNCADASTLAEKLAALRTYQEYLDWEYYPIWPCIAQEPVKFKAGTLKVISVPKNYKQGRMIAPEPAYVNWHGNRLRKALARAIRATDYWELMDLDSQERQQDRAYIASITGGLATIDSSAASDSIARYIMRWLLPDKLWSLISEWLPQYYEVDGKKVVAATFLTSGNPVTFILESVFFLSAALVARDIHEEFTGEVGELPTTFGDDLEVDTMYIDETLMVLDRLGIKVNTEKSFSSGYYRESCGVEYLLGEPMKSIYWPRKTVLTGRNQTPEDYASLVELQHRCYEFISCRHFLSDVVSSYWPTVTASAPSLYGTEFDSYGDLWGVMCNLQTKERPHGAYWKEGDPAGWSYRPEYGYLYGHTQVCQKQQRWALENYNSCLTHGMVEMYQYQKWLQTGPTYASKYDERDGISTQRSVEQAVFPPVDVVRLQFD